MSQYTAGQVNLVNGSQTVTGVGTLFTKYVTVGSVFTVRDSNVPYVVGGITDDTHLTLAAAYAGSTVNNANYAITTSFTPTLQIAYPEQQDVETATLFKRAMLQIEKYLVTAAITAGTIAGVAMTGSTIDGTVIGGTTPAAITGTLITGTFGRFMSGVPSGLTGTSVEIGMNGATGVIEVYDRTNGASKDMSLGSFNSIRITAAGRVLVNGATDDGSHALQVGGDIVASGGVISTNPFWGPGASLGGATAESTALNINRLNGTIDVQLVTVNGGGAYSSAANIGDFVIRNIAAEHGSIILQSGTANPAIKVFGSNRVYIGNSLAGPVDDGVNALQVTGPSYISGQLTVKDSAGSGLRIGSGNPVNPHIRMDASDNVVIDSGTNGPNSALYLNFDSNHNIFTGTGRFIVGSASDNGTDALQVSGSSFFSNSVTSSGSGASMNVKRPTTGDGAGVGPFYQLTEAAGNNAILMSMNAAYGLSWWMTVSGVWQEKMRLTQDGRLLVGYTANQTGDLLQVNGAACVAGAVISGATANNGVYLSNINNCRVIQAATNGAATPLFVNYYGGRVIVGTSSDNGNDALQVNGAVNGSQFRFNNGTAVMYQPNANDLILNVTNGRLYSSATFCPTATNTYPCGTADMLWSAVYAANGTIQTSDRTMKQAITDTDLGLDFINALRPVSYRWKDKAADNGVHYGLIAQEVDELLGRLGVQSFAGLSKPKDAPMGLQYSEFIAPMIKAQQETHALIQRLQERVAALEAHLS